MGLVTGAGWGMQMGLEQMMGGPATGRLQRARKPCNSSRTTSCRWRVRVHVRVCVRVCVCACVCESLSRVRLFGTSWSTTYQVPLSMAFSRQENWSGQPFPSPGNLPSPGIELRSPALQADPLLSEPPGKPILTKGSKLVAHRPDLDY